MKRRRPMRALRRRTARVRSVLLRRYFLPRRQGRAAVLRYAAVLDGQTVNLHARMPHWVRPDEGARIELKRRGRRHTAAAKVYSDHDGGVAMDAAILLGQEVNGLPLTPGRWKIRLRLSRGLRRRSLPLLLVDPPVPYGGPTRPMEASAATGGRYRLGRSVTGNALVTFSRPQPSTEVVRVHVTHSQVDVTFRVVGAEPKAPSVEFAASGRRLEAVAEPSGDGLWQVTVPLDLMVPTRDRAEQWDLILISDNLRDMRLGRRLHDVRNPGRVFAYRQTAVTPMGLHPLLVLPRYTPAGNFRIQCSPMTEAV
ncbi:MULTISPECIES: hypothetical protein [unclassified Streptomyces]|uniref:hypothetical protein n=1 Tax=unclassified Streptomyces TaxID=2593676 RepID=UPI000DAB904F|nr:MULTISPECIES: hypothetical protein [unclassified Streptomyces]PZT77323.1 hypothetical protein DNK56_29410 [Streptomyces sp. AC1-42W]PZT78725.1 hypothetical protein DNK55_03270 [Streptomyces sp. AC1-42T]